jgi:hypothetical protein
VKRRAALAQRSTTGWCTAAAKASTSTPATGEYAPIPPVFGPSSPSKMRLLSCAGAIGIARSPSHSASSDSSLPSRCSSTTTLPSPNRRATSISSSAERASSSLAR